MLPLYHLRTKSTTSISNAKNDLNFEPNLSRRWAWKGAGVSGWVCADLGADMADQLRGEYETRVLGESTATGNRVPAFQKRFGVSNLVQLYSVAVRCDVWREL